ncbi:hypothetical protein AVEN_159235-1 [Araneus ventricosus]|uniref:Uncharacterized protein n=1 Tax=Araneus ventricosus TaxID=182803 RepID=A0A4Y2A0T1_ARAVE|nr:hypothetical protein AVEN_159235-1 [Araneus ventricosus]
MRIKPVFTSPYPFPDADPSDDDEYGLNSNPCDLLPSPIYFDTFHTWRRLIGDVSSDNRILDSSGLSDFGALCGYWWSRFSALIEILRISALRLLRPRPWPKLALESIVQLAGGKWTLNPTQR